MLLSLPFLPFNARNRELRKAVLFIGGIGLVRKLATFAQWLILRRALRRCAAKQRQIWIIQNIQAAPLIRVLAPDAVIYECIDHPFGFSPYPQAIHREWEEMVRDAGHLVATSPSLAALLRGHSNRPIDVISNGVEFDHFALPSPRPADLPDDGRPIVGYVGSVYPWLDYSLIDALCQSCPEYWIVLIGPSHPSVREGLFSLGRYSNFRYLGSRPYTQIPAYVQSFAAGIIPFRRTELTAGVNPVKLYEYAAAGVPMVATPFSDDLARFGAILQQADSREAFVSAVRAAVGLRHQPAHHAVLAAMARGNDWDRKAEELLRVIHTLSFSPS